MNIFEQSTYLQKSIECDLAEIQRLRWLAQQVPTPKYSQEMSGGGFSGDNRATRLIDKAMDMEIDLMSAIDHKLDLERKIYELLNALDPLSSLILRKRYIEGLSVKDISADLDLSERRVHDIKSRAVKKCEEMLKNISDEILESDEV